MARSTPAPTKKPAAPKKAFTAELAKLTAEFPDMIGKLEGEIAERVQRMDALKKEGLIYASEFWRKDSEGNPKYLYLNYPQKGNSSKRERHYVGCDPAEIAKAKAGIARAKEYDDFASVYKTLIRRAESAAEAMQGARHYLTNAKQPTYHGYSSRW